MKKIPALVIPAWLVLAVLPPLHAEDSVKLFESSKDAEEGQRHTAQLSAPLVSFNVDYLTLNGSGEGAGDPQVAAVSVNNMPSAPTLAFNVVGQQFTLAQQPFTVKTIQNDPDKKGFQAQWDLPGGKVVLTLMANDTDPVLYGRVRVERGESSRVILLIAPGGHAPAEEERDRWVIFEGGDFAHGEEQRPMTSNWLLLYDKLLDPESSQNGKGAAGLLWDAPPDANINFQCGSYVSTLTINAPVGDTEFDFILWPFSGVPNESAKAEIKERGPALLEAFSKNKSQLFAPAK